MEMPNFEFKYNNWSIKCFTTPSDKNTHTWSCYAVRRSERIEYKSDRIASVESLQIVVEIIKEKINYFIGVDYSRIKI